MKSILDVNKTFTDLIEESNEKLNKDVVDLEPLIGIKGYCPKEEYELMEEFWKKENERVIEAFWGKEIKETDKSNNLEYYKEKTMNDIERKRYLKFGIK